MKHHVAVKFLAVFLASLALFGAIASGIGITALTALGLYEESVDELYAETMGTKRQNFAVHLVHRYASLNLGELPEDYLYQYYGNHWVYDTYEYGYYFYTIKDERGNVVETTADDLPANVVRYHIQVTEVNYRDMVEIVPWGEGFSSGMATLPQGPTMPPQEDIPNPLPRRKPPALCLPQKLRCPPCL